MASRWYCGSECALQPGDSLATKANSGSPKQRPSYTGLVVSGLPFSPPPRRQQLPTSCDKLIESVAQRCRTPAVSRGKPRPMHEKLLAFLLIIGVQVRTPRAQANGLAEVKTNRCVCGHSPLSPAQPPATAPGASPFCSALLTTANSTASVFRSSTIYRASCVVMQCVRWYSMLTHMCPGVGGHNGA